MQTYRILPRNRFFEVVGGIMFENRGDDKVAMISEVDMSECQNLRADFASRGLARPSYTALVVRALALTMQDSEFAYANRTTIDLPFFRREVQFNQVDISVAVARDSATLPQATYAGTIRSADQLSLSQLGDELDGLSSTEGEHGSRWRLFIKVLTQFPAGLARMILLLPHLWPSLWVQHRGGAVLVSSPAKFGVDLLVGNWGWPIGVSFGLVRQRPVVVDGLVVARPTMNLIMSFDRRLMAGAPAARFFNAIAEKLRTASTSLA